MKKNLSELLVSVEILDQTGPDNPEIEELAYDSREVKPGTLFFALPGLHSDGHTFIPRALEAGAAAVVHSSPVANPDPKVTHIRVANSRTAMSPVAAAFHGHPSRELKVIGVTGTDGKSTTVFFIHQLLTLSGLKAGFLSTVNFNLGEETQKNYLRQSTPEAAEIHRLLRQMVDNGCTHAVVEATSHGLSPLNNRLGDVAFDAAVMTNISHEHLEFHKTLERYVDDKANLFRFTSPRGGTVVNADDPQSKVFRKASRCPVVSYSLKQGGGDLWAEKITPRGFSQEITLGGLGEDQTVTLNQPGRFNAENLMAALLGTSQLTGAPIISFLPLVSQLRATKGRMVPVEMGQPFTLLVDYAHTPGSFEKLFPILREQTQGRLVAVFGSAGERDVEKRPIQGEIASRYSDILILADEDPRQEDAEAITAQIAAGCSGKIQGETLFIIHNRSDAILHACSLARKGDTVVLLGKGHEGSIIYADGPREWDEETEARRALGRLGFTG